MAIASYAKNALTQTTEDKKSTEIRRFGPFDITDLKTSKFRVLTLSCTGYNNDQTSVCF